MVGREVKEVWWVGRSKRCGGREVKEVWWVGRSKRCGG